MIRYIDQWYIHRYNYWIIISNNGGDVFNKIFYWYVNREYLNIIITWIEINELCSIILEKWNKKSPEEVIEKNRFKSQFSRLSSYSLNTPRYIISNHQVKKYILYIIVLIEFRKFFCSKSKRKRVKFKTPRPLLVYFSNYVKKLRFYKSAKFKYVLLGFNRRW